MDTGSCSVLSCDRTLTENSGAVSSSHAHSQSFEDPLLRKTMTAVIPSTMPTLIFPNKDAAGVFRNAFFSSSIEAKSSPPSVVDTSRALAESNLISNDPLSDYLCNALENIIIIFLHLPATTLRVGHCNVRVNKPRFFKLAIHCHRGTHPCTRASLQTQGGEGTHTHIMFTTVQYLVSYGPTIVIQQTNKTFRGMSFFY